MRAWFSSRPGSFSGDDPHRPSARIWMARGAAMSPRPPSGPSTTRLPERACFTSRPHTPPAGPETTSAGDVPRAVYGPMAGQPASRVGDVRSQPSAIVRHEPVPARQQQAGFQAARPVRTRGPLCPRSRARPAGDAAAKATPFELPSSGKTGHSRPASFYVLSARRSGSAGPMTSADLLRHGSRFLPRNDSSRPDGARTSLRSRLESASGWFPSANDDRRRRFVRVGGPVNKL